jgi:hypothetical protein
VRIERRCTYEIIKFNDSVRTRELALELGQQETEHEHPASA